MNPKAKEFIDRSNLRGSIALISDWVMLIAFVFLSIQVDNVLVYLITIWLVGAKQVAIGEGLLHESVHYNLFKTRKLNEWVEF